MPAYFLVDTREIKDAAKMEEYKAGVKLQPTGDSDSVRRRTLIPMMLRRK
jgi:hypothetical protein